MLVLIAISILSFLTLLVTSLVIARHISRVRKSRTPAVPAEAPRNLSNSL
ncbi:hypothetical protein [Granulicella paludicola]|jgi:hypothetical protein|nr:hypothetical protein [Granulicella paludicola]